MSIKHDFRQSSRRAIEQLLALRDEAKLQLHLLSLDARSAFTELEAEVTAIEESARREGDHAADSLKSSIQELTRALNELLAKHVSTSLGLLTSVRTLMSKHVAACNADESLNQAAHLMWSHDCGMIPVVADGKVAGVVTDRDVCMATYTRGRSPTELRVDGAMSKQLFSCGPDDSLGTALGTMREERVRRLPVVNAEAELVGVLSLADVVRWAQPLKNPEVDAAITETLSAICARPAPRLATAAE